MFGLDILSSVFWKMCFLIIKLLYFYILLYSKA